ncbi:MAG: phosphonate metabolism protein/1,5-bisphosphokinase (PRPP-forming) PhnN, partial [Tepidimonas taiwanensis]|nr:phosphonate metabolism protein/1,5-bisphosphokinase (PRPP-forming) PhnN [Tepidimonas taiwanensis]
VFAPLVVISVSADPMVLAARLAARGRESASDIAQRLERAGLALPPLPGVTVREVDNSGDLDAARRAFLAALHG